MSPPTAGFTKRRGGHWRRSPRNLKNYRGSLGSGLLRGLCKTEEEGCDPTEKAVSRQWGLWSVRNASGSVTLGRGLQDSCSLLESNCPARLPILGRGILSGPERLEKDWALRRKVPLSQCPGVGTGTPASCPGLYSCPAPNPGWPWSAVWNVGEHPAPAEAACSGGWWTASCTLLRFSLKA